MMPIKAVSVTLSETQMEAMASVERQAEEAARADKPGMMLAQIFDGHMKVFFADHSQAAQIQLAMGSPVGKITHY